MLTIASDHARLELEKDALFTDVTESIRSLMQVCRMNELAAALVVSHQAGFDLRSSMRVAFRSVAARPAAIPRIRLAVVAVAADAAMVRTVVQVAEESGLACRAFGNEAQAKVWLTADGD